MQRFLSALGAIAFGIYTVFVPIIAVPVGIIGLIILTIVGHRINHPSKKEQQRRTRENLKKTHPHWYDGDKFVGP